MRETGVFTGTTSSPSSSSRQSYDRYAIRAGRNLPDKEFRSTLLLLQPKSKPFNTEDTEEHGGTSFLNSSVFLCGLCGSVFCLCGAEWTFLPLSACRHAVR